MKVTIAGEVPSKKNSKVITKSGKLIPGRRYREWHGAAALQVRAQCRPGRPLEACAVEMVFHHGDLRRRDSDNGATSVLDLLTDCGVIKDDNWLVVRRLCIRNEYDRGNPRVEVSIEELGGGE